MKKFIITGGTSFIGIAFTKLLIAKGHFVYVVCRRSSKTISSLPSSDLINTVYYDDICDIKSIAGKVDYADIFVHLAWGGTSHEGRNNSEIQSENIKYSLETLEIAYQLGCQLFVDAGSQAEYGYITDIITEETICKPENEYGKAKLKFGQLASEYCNRLGMKHIHLRIMSLFGETDHVWTLVMSTIKKMLNNEKIELSSCTQKWNFLYVNDAVQQIYLLCKNALSDNKFYSEVYNIGSHDTRELKDFILEMYRLTKSNSELLFGAYQPPNIVSLNPSVDKTENATNGFIADSTFDEVVNKIINNFNSKVL